MSKEMIFPPELFRRMDESPDEEFYSIPRLVTHIDDATIAALTDFYREVLPEGGAILDLMSSWVSHLPPEIAFSRVAAIGMNAVELSQNPRLTDFAVQDLNREPELPYADRSFDAVVNAVSIQYLTRPVEVYASARRVLRPGGVAVIAMSHRCFPTKAILAWHHGSVEDRLRMVVTYFQAAGGYGDIHFVDRSPAGADPLWLVVARREGGRRPEQND